MAGYDRSRIVGTPGKDLDEFTCGICRGLFNTPVVTQCCRQTYCKPCIEEWLSDQNTCPNDRTILRTSDLIPASRLVINLFNNMRIKCEYEDRGCPVVTTIGELSKHMEECEHKPDLNCKTCGLIKADGEEHNCITNLIIKNNSITDELNRLRDENRRLNQSNTSAMASIEEARSFIHSCEIVATVQMDATQQQYLIEKCKNAILSKNTFQDICDQLDSDLNGPILNELPEFNIGKRAWTIVALPSGGGASRTYPEEAFVIRFGNLTMKLFSFVISK